MTTLAEKLDMLPEARRRKVEALAEELRAEERQRLMTAAKQQEALARPEMREMMRVYRNWQTTDRAQAPYREAQRDRPVIIATDHANLDPS